MAWLPFLVWAACIFIGSTDLLAASNTSRFLGPFIRWCFPSITPEGMNLVQTCIRKGGHLTEYALLAWFCLLGLRFGSRVEGKARRFWIALCIAALYAAGDEFHQGFVSTRTASVMDVGIDTLGAALGLLLVWLKERSSDRNRS